MKVPGPAIRQSEPYPEALFAGAAIGCEQDGDERGGKTHLAERRGGSPSGAEQLRGQRCDGEGKEQKAKLPPAAR